MEKLQYQTIFDELYDDTKNLYVFIEKINTFRFYGVYEFKNPIQLIGDAEKLFSNLTIYDTVATIDVYFDNNNIVQSYTLVMSLLREDIIRKNLKIIYLK